MLEVCDNKTCIEFAGRFVDAVDEADRSGRSGRRGDAGGRAQQLAEHGTVISRRARCGQAEMRSRWRKPDMGLGEGCDIEPRWSARLCFVLVGRHQGEETVLSPGLSSWPFIAVVCRECPRMNMR